jgi:hypothetical protein
LPVKKFRSFLGLAAMSSLFLVFIGCNSQGKASGRVETFDLVAVDGKNLPSAINHSGSSLKVNSGRLTLSTEGECESVIELVSPAGKTVQRKVAANFTQKGERLNFQWKGAGKTTGTRVGDRLSMTNEGIVFEYIQQKR